jgi:hypothetical protein
MKINLLLVATIIMLLLGPLVIYCQCESKTLELKNGSCYEDGVCEYSFSPLTVELVGSQTGCAINLLIPSYVKISDVYMRISPSGEGEPPSTVTIAVGSEDSEPVVSFPGGGCDFNEKESKKERKSLTDSINQCIENREEENGDKECWVTIPFVFKSEETGTIDIQVFTIYYKLDAVEGLHVAIEDETPIYLLWKHWLGPDPKYELEIFEVTNPDKTVLNQSCVDPFYELTENNIKELEPGKKYCWRVRVICDVGKSPWTENHFTLKPNPVKNLHMSGDAEFTWGGDAEHYIIWLNGYELKQEYTSTSFTIEGDHLEYLLSCSETPCDMNILTVWAVNDDKKSDPRDCKFPYVIDRLLPPKIIYPKTIIKEREFSLRWEAVKGAETYIIELFDSEGNSIGIPQGYRKEVNRTWYNPWDEGELKLKPGKTYTLKVTAKSESDNIKPSVTYESFVYDPISLQVLGIFAMVGGFLGGSIRIFSKEHRSEKRQGWKIFTDSQTYMDLFAGVVVGLIIYILAIQLLDYESSRWSSFLFENSGSIFFGFFGGLISYEILKLKDAILDVARTYVGKE